MDRRNFQKEFGCKDGNYIYCLVIKTNIPISVISRWTKISYKRLYRFIIREKSN